MSRTPVLIWDGFSASWEITELATTASRTFLSDLKAEKRCGSGCPEWFGVRFIEPVDVYSVADRALKYAFLFVALSVAAFFLFEELFGLLVAEDIALLMGSVLLFGLLAAAMVMTRELDWYAVGKKAE